MTLQQCRYVLEIANCQSMSKAANALYVTQPSLSRAVGELETELGTVLFERTNRGVRLTPEGGEFLFYARMMLAQEQTLRYRFRQEQKKKTLSFSVASQHFGFVAAAFAGLMGRLRGRGYTLKLREGKSVEVLEAVSSGACDLGVVCVTDDTRGLLARYVARGQLRLTRLALFRQQVFLGKDHPLARQTSVTLEQLRPYPCLTYQQDDMFLHLAEESVNVQTLDQVVYLQDRGTMNSLIVHTDGYNIGTGQLPDGFSEAEMVRLPLENGRQMELNAVERRDRVSDEASRWFLEALKARLETPAS